MFLAAMRTCRAIVQVENKGGRYNREALDPRLKYSGDQIDDCPKAR
jgi:hypothetical protein